MLRVGAFDRLNGITAQQVSGTRVMFGGDDDGTTGIVDVRRKVEDVRSTGWYDLSGRKLNGKPTAKQGRRSIVLTNSIL